RIIQPHVDAALAAESRDAHRSRVRVLIRDKLAGVDIPFDVRAFIGTVWADYLTQILASDGGESNCYAAAVQTMDDRLWSMPAKHIGNVHDFVADIVLDTWFAFDKDGTRIDARLSWISPLRATYIFTGRAGSPVMVFTPEELAWEVSVGKAELILEPVPLFDRAVSVTLEYLAEQKTRRDTLTQEPAVDRSLPPVWSFARATA